MLKYPPFSRTLQLHPRTHFFFLLQEASDFYRSRSVHPLRRILWSPAIEKLCLQHFTWKMKRLINPNPVIYQRKERIKRNPIAPDDVDENAVEPIDQQEVFDHIRDIKDPEHSSSLEELGVVTEDAVDVDDKHSHVRVTFKPTLPHCSMATLIGICLRVKLRCSLPTRYKVDIKLQPGTHFNEAAVNKQMNDKERVAAALENPALMEMVDNCLTPSYA